MAHSRIGNHRPPPVIEIKKLSHFMGDGRHRSQILYENDLMIGPGEVVIMTGPSGSGKTTLLTLIGGLRTVQEGSLCVLGRELRGLGQRELVAVRRHVGFIFQAHNLFGALSAYQNVKLALQLHKDVLGPQAADGLICEMLTRLGLGQRIHHKPEALSGGQRQRVAIARALVHRPKLILADEPTAALDKKSGREVVTLLQEFARNEGSTVLLVTHDSRILDVANRIVNMVDGRIVSDVLVEESLRICEFLQKCEVFAGMTPANLSHVADKMAKESYPARTTIFRQGHVGDRFYVIRSGAVDVFIDRGRGDEYVRTLGPGDSFGELALMSDEPRSASIVVKEDVDLYTLDKEDFRQALDASESLRNQLSTIYFHRA